eukprot:PhM_4_TR5791/c0_g1_i2/m.26924/K15109/SLC25A20_29, CACT, CACL, CRC1; solute carrier family 25 (mitochondrial carnitine/acylcarnitine transporter), member 20/29
MTTSFDAQRFCTNLVAGTAGGIVVTLVGHPFDTLKVTLQTKTHKTSIMDTIHQICQRDGAVRGFYAGVASPLMGQMFFRATIFSTYSMVQYEPSASWTSHFFAGAVTGAAASLVESPIDLFKTQVQLARHRSVVSCAQCVLREQGVSGAYRGLVATLMRNIPANGCLFSVFESLKYYWGSSSNSVVMASGGIAGLSYWLATYPCDVIKSHVMSQDLHKRDSSSIAQTVRALYQRGGISVFYRGITPCLARAVPANAAMLLTVDKVKSWLV